VGADTRLCFCLCAAMCSCPTVGMGCSLSAGPLDDAPELLCWMVRFHLRWASSHCEDGEWCRWGDFVAPHGEGLASTYDRFQRTHGMMQDVHKVVKDDVNRARQLLSALTLLIRELIRKLHSRSETRSTSCERFRRGLNALSCGFGALQTASFVVNLYVYGLLDRVPNDIACELVNGLWSGVGGGSKKFLETAGFDSCLELRDAVLQRYPAHQHYSKDIHVVENMPCEIKRYLQRLYHEFTHDGERILDWHKSVRQIKFVPMFGFPALVLDRDVPVKWVDIDPNWTWDAVVRRWRAASRSRASIPEVE
jgi:hypothetical protein